MFGIGACAKGAGGHAHGQNPFFGQQQEGGACHGPGAVLRELDLSDEQLEQVAFLKLEGLGHCAQVKLALCGQIKQLVGELTKEKIDRAKVTEIVQQIKAEKSKMGDSILERIISFAEVLTPQQRRKLRAVAIKRFLGLGDLTAAQD
jgi:Spy/CpxP family protein refolding chaperone